MQTEEIPVFVYLVIVALGHYTFSMQRVTFNLAKEFDVTQDFFNVLLPVWLVPCQWVLTIVKYSLLLYIFSITMAKEGFGIGLFQVLILFFGAAFVHIFFAIISSTLVFSNALQ